MALDTWGFICLGSDAEDPAVDRAVIERGGLRTTIVAVPDQRTAVRAATELVDNGARLVELRGVFRPVGTAEVVEAVGDRVPVGAAAYGAESVPRLAALLASEAD
ncbi:DUF6506 family protein [Streptomyces caelestis]|uniref:DUF6506 family protein n=1 Tax=Streptomyces caelestis TaxID=36816 RepID=UPI003646BE24